MSKATITRTYVRRYRDNGQSVAYADWSDGSRTEQTGFNWDARHGRWGFTFGESMHMLFARAKRDGLKLERETW